MFLLLCSDTKLSAKAETKPNRSKSSSLGLWSVREHDAPDSETFFKAPGSPRRKPFPHAALVLFILCFPLFALRKSQVRARTVTECPGLSAGTAPLLSINPTSRWLARSAGLQPRSPCSHNTRKDCGSRYQTSVQPRRAKEELERT